MITLKLTQIQLGGLRVGKDKSAFDTWTGYAGNVINDTIVTFCSLDAFFIQYYFDAGNGFSAVLCRSEEGSGDAGVADLDGAGNYVLQCQVRQ